MYPEGGRDIGVYAREGGDFSLLSISEDIFSGLQEVCWREEKSLWSRIENQLLLAAHEKEGYKCLICGKHVFPYLKGKFGQEIQPTTHPL